MTDTTISGAVIRAATVPVSALASTTGSGAVVLASSPALLAVPTAPTPASTDNSTTLATTAFVATAISNAIAAVNPAVAVQAATTAASDTSGLTYLNGASGIGATLTGIANTALTVDGYIFTAVGQRLLVKNDTVAPSGARNGCYYVTQIQTAILPIILTRTLDYDQPSDMNNTGAIPVVNGTANASTTWVLTSAVATVGTDALTFTEFSLNPASVVTTSRTLTAGTGLSGGGNLSADRTFSISVTYAGQTSIVTLGTIATGTWNGTAVAAAYGGTGQTSYAVGDLLYASGATALSKLADVAAGSWLRSGGVTTAPSWSTTTLPNSATTGDLLYASASNAYANLADVAAGSHLRSGGVGAVPVWSILVLPNAATTGDLLYASSANTIAALADVAAGSFLRSGGTSTAPGWSTITVPNAATKGDVWYSDAANSISALTGNITTYPQGLAQTGDGVNSTAPAWTNRPTHTITGANVYAFPPVSATLMGMLGALTGAATATFGTACPASTTTPTWLLTTHPTTGVLGVMPFFPL